MDNRSMIWASRIGIRTDATLWTAKMLVGWFTVDTSLLVNTDGLPSVAAGGGSGFHMGEDGAMSMLSTNAAIVAAGTACSPAVDYGTAADLTANEFTWIELGLRTTWTDASAGTGSTEFFVDGVSRGTITDTMPMDSTEAYCSTFAIVNGPTGTGEIADLAVDWIYTAVTRPGLTNSSTSW
jgi:hypothetical protein